jgi:hypothetical protein
VLGRDRLDPKAADYTAILTKIKSLNPDALYYGGVTQAGVKLAQQAYDIVPNVIKGGPDGMTSSDLLSGAGFPAVEGWYTSIAAPHLVEDTKAAQFIAAFKGRFNGSPDDYTITAHDASLVIIDAVKRVAASGKPVTNARAWSARQRQPRQHRGPEVAECARSTVAEALKALEWAGVLTWQNRITRILVRERDLFGQWASRWQVIRTSNAYVFTDPNPQPAAAFACKSKNLPGTPNQELNLLRPASAPDPHNPLERALRRLGAGIEERLLLNESGGTVGAKKGDGIDRRRS